MESNVSEVELENEMNNAAMFVSKKFMNPGRVVAANFNEKLSKLRLFGEFEFKRAQHRHKDMFCTFIDL